MFSALVNLHTTTLIAVVLQNDIMNEIWHKILKGLSSPAVLVTAYRPDPAKWTDDFKRRKS